MLSTLSSGAAAPVRFTRSFFDAPVQTEEAAVSDTSYRPEEHGTLFNFEHSEGFGAFKASFVSQLNFLIAFAKDHFHDSAAQTVADGFKLMQDRLFNQGNDFYDDHKAVLFGAGKRALDQLIVHIRDESLPLSARLDAIANLARDVQLCAEGAATQLALCADALRLTHAGNDMHRLKEAMVPQLILGYIRESSIEEGDGGMIIHDVNALRNELAERLGLALREETIDSARQLAAEHREACFRYVMQRMTPVDMVLLLADECLSEFSSTMHDHFRSAGDADNTQESFDIAEFGERMEDALVPLKARCGDIDTASLITPLDDSDAMRYRINRDSTLLAWELLSTEKLFKRDMLSDPVAPATLAKYYVGNIEVRIMHYAGKLAWACKNGKAGLLRSWHLQGIEPQDLGAAAKLVAASAIKNSPQSALQDLSLDWMREVGIGRLLSEMDAETITRFLAQKIGPAAQTWEPAERLEFAEAVITFGRPSDLPLCKFDAKILFSLKGPAPYLFLCAMRRGDVGMISALRKILLNSGPAGANPDLFYRYQVQRALTDDVRVAPPLHHALSGGVAPAAIAAFGEILIQAAEAKYLTPRELKDAFSARSNPSGGMARTAGLVRAMELDSHAQIGAFGELLFSAYARKQLDSEDFFSLINCRQGNPATLSALGIGLIEKRPAAVTAFGKIVSTAYEKGILNHMQIQEFLNCDVEYQSELWSALEQSDAATCNAFSAFLLDIDAVHLAKERAAGYMTLSTPELKSLLAPHLRTARSHQALVELKKTMDVFAGKVRRGDLSARERDAQSERLRQRILDGRLGLFLCPGNMRKKKERLFSQVMAAWKPTQADA